MDAHDDMPPLDRRRMAALLERAEAEGGLASQVALEARHTIGVLERELSLLRAAITPRGTTLEDHPADRIIADLCDRRGLKGEWGLLDDDIAREVRDAWAAIIDAGDPPLSLEELGNLLDVLEDPHLELDADQVETREGLRAWLAARGAAT